MTAFILKIIACVSMLIDHATYCFIPMTSPFYEPGRIIGRIAMPIFCFLIVEGFFHTRNLKKYFLRLGVFALLAEFPFDFLLYGVTGFETTFPLLRQNVMFTLLIGLAAIAIMDYLRERYITNAAIYNTAGVITIVGLSMLAELIQSDYSSLGVLCVLIFYFFRGKKVIICISLAVWTALFYYLGNPREMYALFAIIPILLYNGEEGKKIKYLFYIFYPAHMLILALLKCIIVA